MYQPNPKSTIYGAQRGAGQLIRSKLNDNMGSDDERQDTRTGDNEGLRLK